MDPIFTRFEFCSSSKICFLFHQSLKYGVYIIQNNPCLRTCVIEWYQKMLSIWKINVFLSYIFSNNIIVIFFFFFFLENNPTLSNAFKLINCLRNIKKTNQNTAVQLDHTSWRARQVFCELQESYRLKYKE